MDATRTTFTDPRLARRRSAATLDRVERKRHTGKGSRAAYSARRENRATRQSVRAGLRSMTR